jgi:hypothetical protein
MSRPIGLVSKLPFLGGWALYLLVLNPQSANPQQVDALAAPNITDIMYFFMGTKPPRGGVIIV